MRSFRTLLLTAALATAPFVAASHLGLSVAARAATTMPSPDLDPAENARRVAELPALQTYLKQMVDMRSALSGDVKDPKGFRHSAVNDLNDAIRNMRDMIKEYQGDEPAK